CSSTLSLHAALPISIVSVGIFELRLLIFCPFCEESCSTVLPPEVSTERLLKAAAEEQRCAAVLLFPPVEVSIAIASWATQVLSEDRKSTRLNSSHGS